MSVLYSIWSNYRSKYAHSLFYIKELSIQMCQFFILCEAINDPNMLILYTVWSNYRSKYINSLFYVNQLSIQICQFFILCKAINDLNMPFFILYEVIINLNMPILCSIWSNYRSIYTNIHEAIIDSSMPILYSIWSNYRSKYVHPLFYVKQLSIQTCPFVLYVWSTNYRSHHFLKKKKKVPDLKYLSILFGMLFDVNI
jgi:hypothetical protein